jgi:rhodanese-related sulfurtransferase
VIDVNDPREVYEQRGQWEILDVREPYEWETGHIEEAVHIPLGEVMAGGEGGGSTPSGAWWSCARRGTGASSPP